MKNVKIKLTAVALGLATGLAFTGCSSTEETTTVATTTTEATTTTTEETTTAETTQQSYGFPESATPDSFTNELVAEQAQLCADRELYIMPLDEDTYSGDISVVIEGFSAWGGSMHVSATANIDDIEAEVDEDGNVESNADEVEAEVESEAEGGYTSVTCILFTSYEDGVAFLEEQVAEYEGMDFGFTTEETEDGYTVSMSYEDENGSSNSEGILTPDGLLVIETNSVSY